MSAAFISVHAYVINIQSPDICQDRIILDLSGNAESVPGYAAVIINANKDRCGIISYYLPEFRGIVLCCRSLEQIRSAVMMNHVDLNQKFQDPGNVTFTCSSNVHDLFLLSIFRNSIISDIMV